MRKSVTKMILTFWMFPARNRKNKDTRSNVRAVISTRYAEKAVTIADIDVVFFYPGTLCCFGFDVLCTVCFSHTYVYALSTIMTSWTRGWFVAAINTLTCAQNNIVYNLKGTQIENRKFLVRFARQQESGWHGQVEAASSQVDRVAKPQKGR